jgi:NADPH:quinone reductase-like Zn-dependent oxidoreductase
MLAVRIHHFGPPAAMVVEEIPIPSPGPSEVLIRVQASGVGPWDAWIREGQSALGHSLPLTLGSDFAGVVEALGSGVDSISVGDRIYGVANSMFTNAHAEYVVAPLDKVARLPDGLDFIQGASIPVVAVTAWQMLIDHAHVQPGQTVLINGTRGNVGGYAVQLARTLGARVIESSDITPDLRVDAVLDLVGGEDQKRLLPVVKRGGHFISAVAPPPAELALQLGVKAAFFIVNVTAAELGQLAERFERGELVTHIGTVLPLNQAQLAHEMLAGTRPRSSGKIVLRAP